MAVWQPFQKGDHILYLLDYLLEFIHLAVILSNCTFWLFPPLWFIHRITYGLTVFSWLGMGYWYGWGYCFLTDIHWDIKRSLGAEQLPASYVTYMFDQYLRWQPHPTFINNLVAGIFVGIAAIILLQVLWQWRQRHQSH